MIHPDIFKLHPLPATLDREVALRCIDECLDCIAGCTACADDCLAEPDLPDMVRCVRCGVYIPSADAKRGPKGMTCGEPACLEQR